MKCIASISGYQLLKSICKFSMATEIQYPQSYLPDQHCYILPLTRPPSPLSFSSFSHLLFTCLRAGWAIYQWSLMSGTPTSNSSTQDL